MGPLAFLLTVPLCFFIAVALGYRMKRRHPAIDLLLTAAVSLAIPISCVLGTNWDMKHYECVPNQGDPCDAAGMAFVGAVLASPVVWLVGFVICGFGFLIGCRAHPDSRANSKMIILELK